MKTLIIAFCLLLTSSSSFAETRKQKKTQKEVISAFKQKAPPKIDPKLEEALKKKIFNFDGRRVIPSFSHNVFWINHLNPNFSTTPRYNIETITNKIITVIPGKPEEWHWGPKYTTDKVIGWKDVYDHTEYGIGTGKFKPDSFIDHAAVYDTVEYTDWGNWKPFDASSIAPSGEKNFENWAVKQRAMFLAGSNSANDYNPYLNQAKNDLAPCLGSGGANGSCSGVQIAIPGQPPGQCQQASAECDLKLFVKGSYFEGSGQGGGEYKPTYGTDGSQIRELEDKEKEVLIKDAYRETIKGEEITEDKDIYRKDPVLEEKQDKVVDKEAEPEKEEVTYQDEERIQKAKKEWKISYAPAYFIDFDFGKLLLNTNDGTGGRFIQSVKEEDKKASRKSASASSQQGQSYLYQAQGQSQQMQSYGVKPAEIEADNQGPYMVKKFYSISGGLGATASANYANAGVLSQLGLSVALLPTLGGGATSMMFFDTYDEAEKAKHLNIPRNVDEIMNWRDGDTLTYEVHGGVVFTGGAGFYGLAAGVSFLAQGLWQRTFSKIDKTTVLAKLDRNKIFSMGVYGAAGLAGMSVDAFITKENALTFAIDISSYRGQDLLLAFMRGDMRKLQKAAANPKDMTVLSGMKVKGKTKGRSFSFGVGVPYLPASARWNKANFLNESNTEYIGSNRKADSTTNAEVLSFKGKLFPLFKNTSQGFFSNATFNSGAVPAFLQIGRTGQYTFSFQRSYGDRKDLEEVLDSLLRKTGLIGLLGVKIADDVKKVGSAEIKFAIKFKTPATNLLLAQVSRKNLQILDHIGFGFIHAYFRSLDRKKDDVLRLCPARSLAGCEEKIRRESSKAFYDMKKALVEMDKYDSKTKKSRENFAKAYTKFGDAMMENPFTLQTVLAMTLGQGAEVYFSVETSKTKKYEAILRGYPTARK